MPKSIIAILAAALSAVACAESQPAAPPAATNPAPTAAAATPSPAPTAPGSPAASSPPAASPAVSAPPPGAAGNWASMSKDQRKEYMKTVVMPQMKQTFLAFNGDRYKSMNCITCHGDGAMEGKFTMPNPKLPKLPATPAGFGKLMGDKPAVMQFMATKVKPQMAQLLGMPEFTPQSKTGFGCFACHERQAE